MPSPARAKVPPMPFTVTIRRISPANATPARSVPEILNRVIEELGICHLDSRDVDDQDDRCGTLIDPLIRTVAGDGALWMMTQQVLRYFGIDDQDALAVARRTDGELIRLLRGAFVTGDVLHAIYGITWPWTCNLILKISGLPDWAIFRLQTGQKQIQGRIYQFVEGVSVRAAVAELNTAIGDQPAALDDLVDRTTRMIGERAFGDAEITEEQQERQQWLSAGVASAVADAMCDLSASASYRASFALKHAQLTS